MSNIRRATCKSGTMIKTLVLLLLLALWAYGSHTLISQEKSKKETVLSRSKRRWVLTTVELEENLPGPYPRKFTELHNDKHLNHSILFQISGQGVTEEPKDVFSIDETTGDLFIHQAVDREAFPIIELKFDVLDKDTHAIVDRTLAINVVIKDKNDNAPKFIPEGRDININVPENTKEGQLPGSLQAIDIDETGTDNSRVSIRIVSQEPALPKITLDPITDMKENSIRKLFFTGCFNYDKERKYKLLVEARDHGNPSLSSTATVNIYINDSNTHAPVFTAPKFNAEVMEMESNKEILRIPVQDLDTPNTPASRAVFTILKGNEEGNYKIETDPITNEGVLTVIKGKDYEITTLTELEIAVENEEPLFLCVDGKPVPPSSRTLNRNTSKVAVRVIDVNDPPVFLKKIDTVYRVEEEEPGDVLFTPTVTDEDSDTSKIRFELEKDPAKWMSIDPKTGKITLAKKMDRESPYVINGTYTVVMIAIDEADPPGTGTGTLVIKLEDKNDNAPYLACNRSVLCGNKANKVRVTAKDSDDYPYGGPFTYILGEDTDQKLKSMWAFERTVSETFLISLKTLPNGNYSVPLIIADQQGVQARDVLVVVVCDCGNGTVCNDLLPRFSTISGAALGIILGALILILLLLCFCFFCEFQKKSFKQCLQYDGDQTIINYNEEGGGSMCRDYIMVSDQSIQKVTGNCPGLSTKLIQLEPQFQHYTTNMKGNTIQLTRAPNRGSNTTDSKNIYTKSLAWMNNNRDSTYNTTKNGLSRTFSILSDDNLKDHLERKLGKLAMDRVYFPEQHPHDFSSEGDVTNAASLDQLSFHNTDDEMDFLQNMGPKFCTLGEIIQ